MGLLWCFLIVGCLVFDKFFCWFGCIDMGVVYLSYVSDCCKFFLRDVVLILVVNCKFVIVFFRWVFSGLIIINMSVLEFLLSEYCKRCVNLELWYGMWFDLCFRVLIILLRYVKFLLMFCVFFMCLFLVWECFKCLELVRFIRLRVFL